jgi:hypothetical protein
VFLSTSCIFSPVFTSFLALFFGPALGARHFTSLSVASLCTARSTKDEDSSSAQGAGTAVPGGVDQLLLLNEVLIFFSLLVDSHALSDSLAELLHLVYGLCALLLVAVSSRLVL